MSRFFDIVSKPARNMGAATLPSSTPATLERRSRLIRLDSNENPFGPSAHALDAMRNALGTANSYPDDDCSALRLKLAMHHGLPPEQVLVTAGSTGLLSLLCQTLLAPGLNAVTSERSFIVYSMAVQAAGGHLVEAPMRDDSFDLEAILAAIDSNTRIVFLANPNNPTGTMVEADAVERFLARLPGHVVAVLDEAYYEFALHFAALRQDQVFELAGLCSPGSERGRAANFFESSRTCRTARGLRFGPRGIAGILRAHAQYVFGVVGGAGSSGGGARRLPPHSARGGEQRPAVTSAQPGTVGAGLSGSTDRGEFSVLRSRGRGRACRQSFAG